MRKNDKLKNFTNYKMDSEVYKLRRKVINLIYELKNEGLQLPRIDVRIEKIKIVMYLERQNYMAILFG